MDLYRDAPEPDSGVVVTRGGLVESVHHVDVAVTDANGSLLVWAGEEARLVFLRSAAKPMQALPLVEDGVTERLGLTDEELALCCGSHSGEPRHVEGVRSILAKAGLDEGALSCGPHAPFRQEEADRLGASRERPSAVHNNCSGKHAGMLALAALHGWPVQAYQRARAPGPASDGGRGFALDRPAGEWDRKGHRRVRRGLLRGAALARGRCLRAPGRGRRAR